MAAIEIILTIKTENLMPIYGRQEVEQQITPHTTNYTLHIAYNDANTVIRT